MPDIIQLTVVNPAPEITAIRTDEGPPGQDGEDGASTAADVSIADTGGNFAATTVEDALAELAEAPAGSGDMLAANNLDDVADAATAFGNIKQVASESASGVVELATSAETTAGLAVQASDTRLSNSRTPTAHASTHASAGSDPLTLAQSQITNLTTDLAAKAAAADLTSHTGNTSNPHSVTKTQVGLGNADNTSDANKPISSATQTALDAKQPLATVLTNTTAAFTSAQETKLAGVEAGAQVNTVTSVDGDTGAVVTGYDGRITALENAEPTASGSNLVSGGGVSLTGGLTLTVSAALYNILGAAHSSVETILTADTADATHPRYDVVALDENDDAVLITGTPAATPVPPTVDPATQLYLTFISIPAGATSITGTEVVVYDENDDYTMTENGTSVVLDSTNNPFAGTKCIEATTMVAGDYFQAQTASGTIDLGTFNVLRFRIRNKAAWHSSKQITITARLNGAQVGSAVVFKNGLHAFDGAVNFTTYQHIALNPNLFAAGGQPINQIRWACAGGGSAITGFYVDDIALQAGVSQVTDSTRLRDRGAHTTAVQYDVNDLAYTGALISKALQQTPVGVAQTNTTYWTPWAMRSPMIHFRIAFNPKAVCDGTIDRLFLMTVGPDCPNGLKITRWNCSFDADPTTEADLDFKRADAFIGVSNSAVVDILDTTAGVSSETTAANINSDTAVANGKVLYLEFGTAYTADNLQMIFEFWGYAV